MDTSPWGWGFFKVPNWVFVNFPGPDENLELKVNLVKKVFGNMLIAMTYPEWKEKAGKKYITTTKYFAKSELFEKNEDGELIHREKDGYTLSVDYPFYKIIINAKTGEIKAEIVDESQTKISFEGIP